MLCKSLQLQSIFWSTARWAVALNTAICRLLLTYFAFNSRPQISHDYPLNLSILLSGGKETNRDFPSNGE